jgi:hypothetical protein
LNDDTESVCIQATVSNIEQPTGAHIHDGAADSNGPVVVGFTDLISGTLISGCVDAESSLIETIRDNPAAYYLNIHNAEFPAGAVRAQLARQEATAEGFTVYLPLVAR